MGAKHPQDIVKQTGASQFDFIVACNFLVRSGVVKKPADAIRYIEENNIDINTTLEQYVAAIQNLNNQDDDSIDLDTVPDELK